MKTTQSVNKNVTQKTTGTKHIPLLKEQGSY